MFASPHCSKSIAKQDNREELKNCNRCSGIFKSESALRAHMREKHPFAPKRNANTPPPTVLEVNKKPRVDIENEPSGTKGCDKCTLDIRADLWSKHLRSVQHKANAPELLEEGVEIIKTSFQCRVALYRLSGKQKPLNVNGFLSQFRAKAIRLVKDSVEEFKTIKIGAELFGNFILQTKESESIKSFNTEFQLVCMGSDVEDLFQQFTNTLEGKQSEFTEKDNGWALQRLLYLELCINKVKPLKMSSYLQLLEKIEKKNFLKVRNTADEKSFQRSILAFLHPLDQTQDSDQATTYEEFEDELNFEGIEFPVKLEDVLKFEILNNISINVYGLDGVTESCGKGSAKFAHLHITSSPKERHVNLLLIGHRSGINRYCLINESGLISSQLSKRHGGEYLCDSCTLLFTLERILNAHQGYDCGRVLAKVPTTRIKRNKCGEDIPENILKFANFERKLKLPFVVYADFKTIVQPIKTQLDSGNSSAEKTHKLIPYSFGYYVKCDFDDSLSKYEHHTGSRAHKVFVERLKNDCKFIYNYLKDCIQMSPLSFEQKETFRLATVCHICEMPFKTGDKKVRDHCHMTGAFRGAAHSLCNLHFKIPKVIPVFFHNLSNFDTNQLIKELVVKEGKLDVIAESKEQYIAFTKPVLVGKAENKSGKEHNVFLKLQFIDSFRFMATGLDKLSQNLENKQCRVLRKFYPQEEEFQLIRQKGVFPYPCVDSFSKADNKNLLSQNKFYSQVKTRKIKQDFKRTFKCTTLKEYLEIYLKSDVLILADIFENFRDLCVGTYGLDPCRYFAATDLSLDAALKFASIELELLTDLDMIQFIKRGIRGGISQCNVRKATANNEFLPHYNPSEPSSYILYLKLSNMYASAMSQYLPKGNFKWLTEEEIKHLNYTNIKVDSKTGYVLEVDLDYPEDLHNNHSDLPFCPESIVSPNSGFENLKLIANFNRKSKYIVHHLNLQQALNYGLKLRKIYRVLSFDQTRWLKGYIHMNTSKRIAAKNEFEKYFFKLMINAVSGGMLENVEKRVDVKLVTHWDMVGRKLGAEALSSKPHFKDIAILDENLVAIQMASQNVDVYNKPIYVGFTILEISKIIMYGFLHDHIKSKYMEKAVLLYTDTDSLILKIESPNVYNDMKENLGKFDTSNYQQDNIHGIPVEESTLIRMKDVYAGKIIWEFRGTGSKSYCLNVDGELSKKPKGVPDYITQTEPSSEDYYVASTQIPPKSSTFRSNLRDMYIELNNEVALSDNKRYLLPD